MTNRHEYMRQWQARRRWPIQVQTALARLETLLGAKPEGAVLPEMPAAVRAAWGVWEPPPEEPNP